MSINKDKSEIAESFRNLLQKADEMALNKKKDDLIERFNLEENDKTSYEINNKSSNIEKFMGKKSKIDIKPYTVLTPSMISK